MKVHFFLGYKESQSITCKGSVKWEFGSREARKASKRSLTKQTGTDKKAETPWLKGKNLNWGADEEIWSRCAIGWNPLETTGQG